MTDDSSKIPVEDAIAELEAIAALARTGLSELPAQVAPHNAQLREKLEAEMSAVLQRVDVVLFAHLRRLRDIGGHA